MAERFELHFTDAEQYTDAISLLTEHTGLSKTRVKDAMSKGAVWLRRKGKQRRLRRSKTKLLPADQIALFYDSSILEITPPEPELIDDRGSFSVWSKPPGLLSGGSRFGDHCAIDRVVSKYLDRQTFIVHRLDHFAWGLMLLAHNKRSAGGIGAQFQSASVGKRYQAIVHGNLNTKLDIKAPVKGKPANSLIIPIAWSQNQTLVNVTITTGRKHQIRVHLSAEGYPIVGDRQYGGGNKTDLQLASVELSFTHPGNHTQLTYSLTQDRRPVL